MQSYYSRITSILR